MPISSMFRRPPSLPLAALALLLAAVVLRVGLFGNPLFGDDEEFYPLVGERLLHGVFPYLGIWDRKPFGLFALFAAMEAFGGDPARTTQFFAFLSAFATSTLIYVIAVRCVPWTAALLAGLFYLVMLAPLAGGATQTAIYYNLLTAIAAWLVLGTAPGLERAGDLRRACGTMLLCGLAIQIKTNAAFEGAAFGLWLLTRMRRSRSPRAIGRFGALFIFLGVLPTAAAGFGYLLAGHGGEWWFANFRSQLLKQGGFDGTSLQRLLLTMLRVSPLVLAAGFGLHRGQRSEPRGLLAWWSAAALIDATSIGNFWTFYWLPFAVPASILSAQLFARPRWGAGAFAVLSLPALVTTVPLDLRKTARAQDAFRRTMAVLPADTPTRCLFTYDAPVAYLQYSQACLVTPFIFVDQLRSGAEAHALPVDATIALKQALARRPGTVLTVAHSLWTVRNRRNDALLRAALARDYRQVASVPQHRWRTDPEIVVVWRRRDLPYAPRLPRR